MNDFKTLFSAAILGLLTTAVWGQSGQERYEMLCGACHGIDGKGAGEGGFPPLAGSEWVKGDPERMVQVILHGLEGPVKVGDKTYNLMMPPQGAALTDEHIAEIVTYVRGAWGNDEKGVDVAQVKNMRGRTAKRTTMWKSSQLLGRWPLPEKKGPLNNLVASFYKGNFKTMPDFSQLQADAVEEEAGGYLDLSVIREKNGFAMVWEGEFEVAADRNYTFRLDSDDGSRLFVNGTLVTEVKGMGGMGRPREGRTFLKKGMAKMRVEYFENRGDEGIALQMKAGGQLVASFIKPKAKPKRGPAYPPILLTATEQPRIFRNFIKGTSARAIGVGYPGGVNLAFSADDLAVSQAWVGDFIDAGRHWTGRGQGLQEPGGLRVVDLGQGPAIAILSKKGQWPTAWQPELKARFNGYFLDKHRRPEFRYRAANVQIFEKPVAVQGRELVRNFRLEAGKNRPENLAVRVSGKGAKALGSHLFEIGKGIHLAVSKSDIVEPVTIDGQVVLKFKLKQGSNRVGVRYVWK